MRRAQRKALLAKCYLILILFVTFFSVGLVLRPLGLSKSIGNTLEEEIVIEPCSHYLKEIAIHKDRQSVECERILKAKSK